MGNQAMTSTPDLLTVTGVIEGPISLMNDELQWGPVTLRKAGGQVRFIASVDVTGRDEGEILDLKSRIGPAVEAAVVASCGAATRAEVTDWSYPSGPLTLRVGVAQRSGWNVPTDIDRTPDDVVHGEAALQAVLADNDKRLKELFKVYRLGIEGVQTIAPVLGLWAFAVLLEEESPRRPPNLAHVPELTKLLHAVGSSASSPPPTRQLDRIRAAALHPTPSDPIPSSDEVQWFRELAGAYLRWRAEGRPQTPLTPNALPGAG